MRGVHLKSHLKFDAYTEKDILIVLFLEFKKNVKSGSEKIMALVKVIGDFEESNGKIYLG